MNCVLDTKFKLSSIHIIVLKKGRVRTRPFLTQAYQVLFFLICGRALVITAESSSQVTESFGLNILDVIDCRGKQSNWHGCSGG